MLKLLCKLTVFALVFMFGCDTHVNDTDKSSIETDLLLKIQEDLPTDWTCTVITDDGKKGHPHGLDEPLFRADFMNIRISFSNELHNPYIPLFFYDIGSKSKIMKTIDKEKMFSWDIPLYFGETDNYLVVTSPAYVNHGVFTVEAKNMIKPMWSVLRRYILNIEGTNIDQLADYP